MQLQVQLVVAQVYMVQLWFRVGVTSMWFRCVSALWSIWLHLDRLWRSFGSVVVQQLLVA